MKKQSQQKVREELARMEGALDEALCSFGFKAKDMEIERGVKAIPCCTGSGQYYWDVKWNGGERTVSFFWTDERTVRDIACVVIGVYYALGGDL